MKLYDIFDIGKLEFDENKTIAELVETAFEEYGYWEPAGIELVTIYDAEHYNVVLDRNKTCKEAGLGKKLCIAYFKPNTFFYVEGGWGHHMIQMNAVKYIDNPIWFQLIFDKFQGVPVINGNVTLRQMFKFLSNAGYIDEECHRFIIYEWDEYYSMNRVLRIAGKTIINIEKDRYGDIPIQDLRLIGKVGVIS